MTEREAYISLNLVEGVGLKKLTALIEYFGSAMDVLKAKNEDLRALSGITDRIALEILNPDRGDILKDELEKANKENVEIITLSDANYPEELAAIYDPPPVLYVKGELKKSDINGLGIVGTRKATAYGTKITNRIATECAESGICIISGMAEGIDTVAHKACLKAGGRTIAVLGTGIDKPFPAANKKLYKEIIENGAVISEFPVGTLASRGTFPRRNRIISALSKVIAIIEAAEKSGALITADFAIEHGKEIMALPGDVTSRMSEGPNRLIKDGAGVILSVDDILQCFGKVKVSKKKIDLKVLTKTEKTIAGLLEYDIMDVDSLLAESKLSIADLQTNLLNMELKDIISKGKGALYSLK